MIYSGGVKALLGSLRLSNYNKRKILRELCCEKVLTQKGNSPKYLLRPVNKVIKYEKIFSFGVLIIIKNCISLSCPGS